MNNALAELYGSDNLIRLADKDSRFDHSVWDRAVKWLHSKRGYEIDDKPVRDLINETYRVLSEGVNGAITEEVPAELTQSLLNNTYIFSGFKTYHEMRQASALLRSSTGGFKSFEKFYRDVKKIDNTYNRSYLAAEYEFAVQSTQMAVKWKDWEEDGDRYLLQYRTAGDERVREEHAALNNTTLPMDDKFWDSYLPPLGWRCRCTVVQVRKGKYPVSDSDAACSVGEHATSLPKQKIFRFNPGKTGKVFPPKHPYLPKGCGACELKLSFNPKREVCKVCLFLDKEKRYQYNKDLYDKLSKDPKYTDVEFDEETGGLVATHRGHNKQENNKEKFKFADKKMTGAELEIEAKDILYKAGHSVIFCDELKKGKDGNKLSALDMVFDGKVMDIRSITKDKEYYGYPIRDKNSQLKKYNSRSDVKVKADTVCLYFHEPKWFTPEKIYKGVEWAKGQTSKFVVKHIVCVLNTSKGAEVITFDIKE